MLPAHSWKTGDHLTHRFNPELGVGRITAVEGRTLVVSFPRSGATLRLAAATDVLVPVDAASSDTWRMPLDRSPFDRLAAGDLDDGRDALLRLRILHLLAIRQAGGLGSFLGGRVRLFPHQLHVAERAAAADPVRWLLADEVGLGKTIEACLILTRLVHAGQIERCLIVAPNALTVQWLGELWRKYHQVFTLLDEPRLADVARDFGENFNPFDVHRRAVIGLEMLVERPLLTRFAASAGIDLLVIDEAQRLRRPPGHPGDPAYRAVAPIAALGRHVLLLSATPLEDDAHGFFRLLQLLRPDEFPDDMSFEARLEQRVPLPPCTSSTRRTDIGGLPPRVGVPVSLTADEWSARAALENALRLAPVPHAVARRRKLDRIQRALSSGAALKPLLGPDDRELHRLAEAADAADPRLQWLTANAARWRDAGDKTLVFVAHRETLELVRAALSQRAQLATGAFHEDLSPARRDLEVAQFRAPDGPSLLVSTEAGGEGRNFEFCRRLVLFDLPWRPTVVEQRVGRLDRIGRQLPVEIVYFHPPGGVGAEAVRVLETLGVFREPLAGLEPELVHIEDAIAAVALGGESDEVRPAIEALIADARAARTRILEAAYQELHRDPYRPDMAERILARVPANLDELVERVITTACERLGFGTERIRGQRKYAIEFGNEALVDSLPGVPAGATFVGTFDREEAVQDETIDFFSSGHSLVEGILLHYDDSGEGRVACVELPGSRGESGIVAIYRSGADIEVIAVDRAGRRRHDWTAVLQGDLGSVRWVRADRTSVNWDQLVTRLRDRFDFERRPYVVLGIVAG